MQSNQINTNARMYFRARKQSVCERDAHTIWRRPRPRRQRRLHLRASAARGLWRRDRAPRRRATARAAGKDNKEICLLTNELSSRRIDGETLNSKKQRAKEQPRAYAECERVRDAEFGHVARPQRLEVVAQTDEATSGMG